MSRTLVVDLPALASAHASPVTAGEGPPDADVRGECGCLVLCVDVEATRISDEDLRLVVDSVAASAYELSSGELDPYAYLAALRRAFGRAGFTVVFSSIVNTQLTVRR